MVRLTSRPPHTQSRFASFARRTALLTLAVGALGALVPRAAGAQFGMLKKLKEAKDALSGPDSAQKAKDSLAKVQKLSGGEVALGDSAKKDTTKKEQSFFSRAKSAASKVSDKVESTTGVSVKDAALAASGVGIAGIAAKKLGVDPASLASNAMGKLSEAAQKKAALSNAASSPTAALQAMADGGGSPAAAAQMMQQQMQSMQAMQGMQAAAMKAIGSAKGSAALSGMPDAQLMLAFQQEMMQVATDATGGNAVARQKLEAWNALTAKFESQAAPLTVAVSGGDMAAYAKLQALQTGMMREWLSKYGSGKMKP
jgi:hypothetical protein